MEARSLAAAAVGVAAHQGLFIRGEWHVRAPRVFRFYLLCAALFFILQFRVSGKNVVGALYVLFSVLLWHVFGLFASIVTYRLAFHPLRRFPGPVFARMSKIWHVWGCRTSQNHLFLDKLRETYGDFVRTGPNEITIFHPDGLAAINKIGDVERGSWYDLVSPAFSVNTVRNQAMHDRRRKVWEAAFTPEAMKDYEHRIRRHAGNVETSLRKAKTTIIDMNSIIYRFGYSVMSDLAFGKEADEMDTEWQRAFRTMHMGLSLLGPLSPAPWIALLFFSFTWIPWVRDWNAMMKYCSSKMQERVAMSPPPKSRDISSWLIEDAQRRQQLGTLEEQRWLDGDGFSVILAGSDTTASTLIFAFNYLAKRPEYQHRIRDELARALRERGVDDAKEDPDLKSLNFRDFERLSFLNAFIDELLRLHHPLPTAGARVVQNPAGLDIGGQHIPRGTNVVAPRWCDGRCETHYERAREFIPERWLNRSTQSEPDEKKLYSNRRAFTPWAGGRWSCLGKPLALFEMRYLISLLVSNFNITFPAGESGDTVEWGYKDQVTAFPGQVNLEFQPSK